MSDLRPAPHLCSNGEFEVPLIPDCDSFRINGVVVARQLGFRDATAMTRTLADDEKLFVDSPQVTGHTNSCAR
ncbi:MAG TPA: hypothetical protein PLC22_03750 [Gordonia sp. (in: high G+C Gram-positive bacteria)]|nr:hypothetical protein [Gordonia sp. (in: high G+C Gram-positive bacteria)]